jgi:hypothetical protein
MELNYESDITFFVDEDNICQYTFSKGTYIPDHKLFELFTKVDGKVDSIGGDLGISLIISLSLFLNKFTETESLSIWTSITNVIHLK